uniref:Uncharacterized protein n=1 Tax=Calcidiscus leptoporus TaxID=127549 RepID=A0A7S0P4Q1_9EUKA|mmetsp:Transcript_58696/g.134634  ORF Transcript_58696/g.134634 Transcript_58696/m.134634 type:complete len:294 (+) Transcript_58696:79-960(+)
MVDMDELPKPEEIEVETNDIYRHDEEQAYITLISQQVKSLNFPAEENYTVRLMKEILVYHYPDELPMGSFELLASNKIRSDEETLGEIFNGDPYFTDKEPAEDPDFDWTPRKEQVFSDKMLMQLSIWKKEWDEDKREYEPIDLSYSPYGYEQTRKWKKLGFLNEKNVLRPEAELIEEGKITDAEMIDDYKKRQATIAVLRSEHCFRLDHARECSNEIAVKDDVNEALEWLRIYKEKDFNKANELKQRREGGEEIEIEEEDPLPDDPDVQIYVCPAPMGGLKVGPTPGLPVPGV